MKAKSPKKTAKTAIVRTREVEKTVYTTDIKWDTFTYPQLMQLVHDNVPKDIPLGKVRFSFDVETSTGYYDDVTAEATMSISYLVTEEY